MTGVERRRQEDRRGHVMRLGAYVLVVVMGILGFHSIDVEAYRRCQATNTNALALRRLVEFSTRNTGEALPPNTPDAVVELIRRGRVQADQLRAFTERNVVVQRCNRPWPAWDLGKP